MYALVKLPQHDVLYDKGTVHFYETCMYIRLD